MCVKYEVCLDSLSPFLILSPNAFDFPIDMLHDLRLQMLYILLVYEIYFNRQFRPIVVLRCRNIYFAGSVPMAGNMRLERKMGNPETFPPESNMGH